MSEPLPDDEPQLLPLAPPANEADPMQALRHLVVGPEQEQLAELQRRQQEAEARAGEVEAQLARTQAELQCVRERQEGWSARTRDVAEVLPAAVGLAPEAQLDAALAPTVVRALHDSVKRNPYPLADAVSPAMGPAIRRAVREWFSKLVQEFNKTLDQSLSVRGLRWRWEARRTGKPFAEVVLAHTLAYQVEDLFLIHRPTGLLLLHRVGAHFERPGRSAPKEDMVSGMLTAITDFVRDSFQREEEPTQEAFVETLRVEESTVWVAIQPQIILAAVVWREAPIQQFSETLARAAEEVSLRFRSELEAFQGDPAPFQPAQGLLEACLQPKGSVPERGSPTRLIAAGVVVLLLLAVWAFYVMRGNRRWRGYVESLQTNEGLVVTETYKRGGRFRIVGLRDPLAVQPDLLLTNFHLTPDKVTHHWRPFLDLSSNFVLLRARIALEPPAGVALTFSDGVLVASATTPVPPAWVEMARARARALPGVYAFTFSGAPADTPPDLAALQRQIEQTPLLFGNDLELASGQGPALDKLVAALREMSQEAARAGKRARITVTGHTDHFGTEAHNQRLSLQRAEEIIGRVADRGVPRALFVPRGVGWTEPAVDSPPGKEEPRNRRVTFRVTLEEAAPVTRTP